MSLPFLSIVVASSFRSIVYCIKLYAFTEIKSETFSRCNLDERDFGLNTQNVLQHPK